MCFGNSATKPYVAARACEWLGDGFSRRVFCLPWILVSRKYCKKASWSLLQIPHQLSFSTAGAKCRQMQTTETAEIQQDVGKYTPSATTVFRCGRCAILVLFALQKSQHKTAKDYQSERWMPVISTSSLEKRAQDLPSETVQVTFLRSRRYWKSFFGIMSSVNLMRGNW